MTQISMPITTLSYDKEKLGMTAGMIKYPGSKRRQAKFFAKFIGEVKGTYHEPFFGSGAVFFKMHSRNLITSARLSDLSTPLIMMWKRVQQDPARLMDDLFDLPVSNDKDTYLKLRARFNETYDPALYIWLNKAGFNGLMRYNKSGKFNVPVGTFREQLALPDEGLILQCHEALQCAEIVHEGFDSGGGKLRGDVNYVDSPYVSLPTKKSFVHYTPQGFDMHDQRRLVKTICATPGQTVASNADCPAARALYRRRGWTVYQIQETRSISAKKSGRGKVSELVATWNI